MLTAIEAIVDDIVSVVSIVVKLCLRLEFMRLFLRICYFPASFFSIGSSTLSAGLACVEPILMSLPMPLRISTSYFLSVSIFSTFSTARLTASLVWLSLVRSIMAQSAMSFTFVSHGSMSS